MNRRVKNGFQQIPFGWYQVVGMNTRKAEGNPLSLYKMLVQAEGNPLSLNKMLELREIPSAFTKCWSWGKTPCKWYQVVGTILFWNPLSLYKMVELRGIPSASTKCWS